MIAIVSPLREDVSTGAGVGMSNGFFAASTAAVAFEAQSEPPVADDAGPAGVSVAPTFEPPPPWGGVPDRQPARR
jgi:hypothetical protein